MSIPKILHQIWIGPKEPPTIPMDTWKDKHPDFENYLEDYRFLPEIPEHYKTLFYKHAQASGFDSSFLKFIYFSF